MGAKNYLRQYQEAKGDIANKKAKLAELEELVGNISSGESSDGIRTSAISDKTGESAVKIADMKEEINRDIMKLVDILEEVESIINQLENGTYRRLLCLRYIEGLSWEKVAVGIHHDVRWTYKLHGRALQQVEKILQQDMERQYKPMQ